MDEIIGVNEDDGLVHEYAASDITLLEYLKGGDVKVMVKYAGKTNYGIVKAKDAYRVPGYEPIAHRIRSYSLIS